MKICNTKNLMMNHSFMTPAAFSSISYPYKFFQHENAIDSQEENMYFKPSAIYTPVIPTVFTRSETACRL